MKNRQSIRGPRLFLVRHGQAGHNLDITSLHDAVDAGSEITEQGWKQAQACGLFFHTYFADHPAKGGVAILTSSYKRCLQTTQGIHDGIARIVRHIVPVHAFVEQNFGAICGVNNAEQRRAFPGFVARQRQHLETEETFFLRYPHGESLADVYARVQSKFGLIRRLADSGVTNVVIVTHSRTLRCIVTAWLNVDYKPIFREPPPGHCDVRLIEGSVDRGYIYKDGRESFEPEKERRTTLDEIREGKHRPEFLGRRQLG